MVEIRQGDFVAFFAAPFSAYGQGSLYVSPIRSDLARYLNPAKNPTFSSDADLAYFTAHRNGQVLGRITAHVHPASNQIYGTNRANFGYFDCADDPDACKSLLSAAEDWATSAGFNELAGNFNLTAMQQIGVQTENFDREPYTDLMYNPPHIPRLLEENGYQAYFPMTTFENDLDTIEPDHLLGPKQQAILGSSDFEFVTINRRTIAQRLEDVRVILNDAFEHNPMFVPLSREEFEFQSKEMKWIMDPRISAVLHFKGAPAATVICIPDLNSFLRATRSRMGLTTPWHFLRHRMRRRRAVLICSAVRQDLQGQGVNPVVLHRVLSAMKQAGYRRLGGTWISDENTASLRQKEKMGARPLHRLHLFRKAL